MTNSIQELESLWLAEIQEINTAHRNEVKDLAEQLAIATTKLEQSQYQVEKLDKGWNKTIDAHEVTRQRLLKYENEVGTVHNLKFEQSQYTIKVLRQSILDMSATQNYLTKDNAHLTEERAYWREKACKFQSKWNKYGTK